MPKGSSWTLFILINLFFVVLFSRVYLAISLNNIKMNWAKYRCNPMMMPMSDNVMEDFTYCVQNTQATYMKQLMQPIMYLVNSLSSVAGVFNFNILDIRKMFDYIRKQVTFIVKSLFAVILSIIVEFQRLIVGIKDLVMKIVGITAVTINLVDGSIKTGQSAWNGPPGNMVRGIHNAFACFDPKTRVRLDDGSVKRMKDLCLGDILEDGGKVNAVMKLANYTNETYYRFKGDGVDGDDIYVTGSHFVQGDKGTFVHVKNHPDAVAVPKRKVGSLSCLITDTHQVRIGKKTFWDWDDDILYGFKKVDDETE